MTKKQPKADWPEIPDYQNCYHIPEEDYQKLMPMIRAFQLGDGRYLTQQQFSDLVEEGRYCIQPPSWWGYMHKDLRNKLMRSFKRMKRTEARLLKAAG